MTSTPHTAAPSRYVNLDRARERFGNRVDWLAPWFFAGDPLADAVVEELAALRGRRPRRLVDAALAEGIDAVRKPPPALRTFFRHVEAVPDWVDWDRIHAGGHVIARGGLMSGLALACGSLPRIYLDPAGNKPLTHSGQLTRRATRRLAGTARYAVDVSRVDGLRRGQPGFCASVKVRLIHAHMRRLLTQCDTWQTAAWGTPLNQVDLAFTQLVFSSRLLDDMALLGGEVTAEEQDAVVHQWRYAGHLIGVDPALCPVSMDEGRALFELIQATRMPGDQDSVDLVDALLGLAHGIASGPIERRIADQVVRLEHRVVRHLVGPESADLLGLSGAGTRPTVAVLRAGIAGLTAVATRFDFVGRWLASLGLDHAEFIIERGLGGHEADFDAPQGDPP